MPDSTWTGLSARGLCSGTQSGWYCTFLQATFRDTGSGREKPEHSAKRRAGQGIQGEGWDGGEEDDSPPNCRMLLYLLAMAIETLQVG
jgi:hypothetical protein